LRGSIRTAEGEKAKKASEKNVAAYIEEMVARGGQRKLEGKRGDHRSPAHKKRLLSEAKSNRGTKKPDH